MSQNLLTRRSLLAGAASLPLACSGNAPLVLVGGRQIDAATIDRDPIAVLPSGVIMLGYMDLATLYRTGLGGDVTTLVSNFVPIGNESNFVPARDTQSLYGGIYAMQGVDFCAVTKGRFDVAAIQRAADVRAAAAGGAPLVKTRYADTDIYTVGNIGFVLLTPSTMLSGNETGMRRALDRLRQKSISRSVPRWAIELTETAGANFALAGDFGADAVLRADPTGEVRAEPLPSASPALPAIDAAAQQFPFFKGMRALRILGNFAPPGLNLAGSVTYDTPENAVVGADSLARLSDLNPWLNLLMAIGLGVSLPPMITARNGRDVAFTQPIDERIGRAIVGAIITATRRA